MGESRFQAVPFTQVAIEDAFWAPRLRANRERTIPHVYRKLKEIGCIDAFKLDWKPGKEPVPHVFWDSDVAKWVEAASYSIAGQPDPALERLLDEVVSLIASAQQPDGYLNCHFTVVEPDKRWTNLRDLHELYCAGHLIEAAVAHYQATGKRTLLDAMCRYADYIGTVFGPEPGQRRGYCGHEEIELALVKLYRVTGEERYLRLARYFVEERGRRPHYYDEEALARGEDPEKVRARNYDYCQAHKPVREHEIVGGHAVRAMYLYSAVADLAGELGDAELRDVSERLWSQLTSKRMYITGGIGSTGSNEGFSTDYDLPNETAYAETCAAIGLVLWSHRMLQLDCDARYADVMERALYNGILSGISLEGTHFFYANPLASDGAERPDWYGCACCPTNIIRLLASLGQYVYSESENEAAVHLYIAGSGTLRIAGQEITIRQETNYPWDGRVLMRLEMPRSARFGLRLRIPGWCREARLRINGGPPEPIGETEKGYLRIERQWESGDSVEIGLPMPVERMSAHPDVRQDAGRVALQRGPIVYCLEHADNREPLHRLVLPLYADLLPVFDKDLLGGVVTIVGNAEVMDDAGWKGTLYRRNNPATRPCRITAIPYYAWANRQPGPMAVWVREE